MAPVLIRFGPRGELLFIGVLGSIDCNGHFAPMTLGDEAFKQLQMLSNADGSRAGVTK